MTDIAERRQESSEELNRGFLEHAGVLLRAQEQTDWHLQIEATEVIEDILGTLNETGPYAYTYLPAPKDGGFALEDGRLRARLCNTRDEIREAYVNVHKHYNLQGWRTITQIIGSWYTFHGAYWKVLYKEEGVVRDTESLLLFPTMGKRGITGEMVWPRLEPPPERTNPERRFELLAADQAWFAHLASGNVAGALECVKPEVQVIVRNYANPTPGMTHVEVDGSDALGEHLQAFNDRYAVEAIDVIHRHVDDWYVFTETRWTARSVQDGSRWSWLRAEFGAYDNGLTMNGRFGHGTYPVAL
jgi:hypothetical protein